MFFERSFKKDYTDHYLWARLMLACSDSLGGADKGIVRAHFLEGIYGHTVTENGDSTFGHAKFELDPIDCNSRITMPLSGKWGDAFLRFATEWKWVDISWRRDKPGRISFRMYPSETFPKMYW